MLKALEGLALGILVWLNSAVSAEAVQSTVFEAPSLRAQLIFTQDGVSANSSTLSGALILDLEPGWKTYWRSPGEVGLPPSLDWSRSINIRSSEILWPAPQRFEAFGIDNFGYEERVVFPLQIVLDSPGEEVVADLSLDLLVCSDVCVPQAVDLSVTLPTGDALDYESSEIIAAALETVPNEGLPAHVSRFVTFVDAELSEIVFELEVTRPLRGFDLFPDLGPDAALGKPEFRVTADETTIWARFPINYANPEILSSSTLTVVEEGAPAFSEALTFVDTAPVPPVDQLASLTDLNSAIWFALLAALGGLILNVMPCVLPVLGIKFSSVIGAEKSEKRNLQLGLLATSLGIFAFMWVLALSLMMLKSAGATVGWGIQFQNPAFLAVSIVLLLLFAGNMFGLFEFVLPTALQERLGAPGRPTLSGDFFTGFFAALLATPCSAPFLGSAVAFALTGGPVEMLIIFTALGLGLASPYLLIAAFPSFGSRLPKPGRWMIVVKWVVASLLIGTVVWLGWVMISVSGRSLTALTFTIGVGLIILLHNNATAARHALLLSFGAILALLPLSEFFQQDSTTQRVDDTTIAWEEFDRSAVARLVSRGTVVFVDVTADWCVTCKANKVLVLERSPVFDILEQDSIVAMQADWTRPDERIARYLESQNRFGIPFNAVYGPNAPNGIILPEILTSEAVLEAINDAALSDIQQHLLDLSVGSTLVGE